MVTLANLILTRVSGVQILLWTCLKIIYNDIIPDNGRSASCIWFSTCYQELIWKLEQKSSWQIDIGVPLLWVGRTEYYYHLSIPVESGPISLNMQLVSDILLNFCCHNWYTELQASHSFNVEWTSSLPIIKRNIHFSIFTYRSPIGCRYRLVGVIWVRRRDGGRWLRTHIRESTKKFSPSSIHAAVSSGVHPNLPACSNFTQ